MDRPKHEVTDVFRRYGAAYRLQHGASLSVAQRLQGGKELQLSGVKGLE